MTRGRKVVLGVFFLLAAGGSAYLYWILNARDRIDAAHYERIEAGMHLSEVEALLGREAGGIPPLAGDVSGEGWGVISQETLEREGWRQWNGRRFAIAVEFDVRQRVIAAFLYRDTTPPSVWQRLRRWATGPSQETAIVHTR